MNVTNLKVSLDFGDSIVEVGTLFSNKERVYFKFSPGFLSTGIKISPFKLKQDTAVLECPNKPFDGVFGVFNDSIPDGWGRLLLDRKLLSQGIHPQTIGVLDRLALVGKEGQGALIYEPIIYDDKQYTHAIDLDVIADETENILNDSSSSFLDNLYHLGGNSIGARPKIMVNYDTERNQFGQCEKAEPWIIKFSALNDLKDSAKIEYAYYLMATEAGIEMTESKLFLSEKGRSFFGTKRFDRKGGERLHFHTACGLLHDDFRFSTLDYGHVMDAANRLEIAATACEKVFRLAVFNVFACNMDDHSKNLGFLMDDKGKWRFAPAYDLTFSPSKGNFQSLSVANAYQNVGLKDLLKLSDHFNVKSAQQIIQEVKHSLSKWDEIAQSLEIRKDERRLVKQAIENKLKV
jgi:serine/threonine-protein kinase HipA